MSNFYQTLALIAIFSLAIGAYYFIRNLTRLRRLKDLKYEQSKRLSQIRERLVRDQITETYRKLTNQNIIWFEVKVTKPVGLSFYIAKTGRDDEIEINIDLQSDSEIEVGNTCHHFNLKHKKHDNKIKIQGVIGTQYMSDLLFRLYQEQTNQHKIETIKIKTI